MKLNLIKQFKIITVPTIPYTLINVMRIFTIVCSDDKLYFLVIIINHRILKKNCEWN